MKQLDNFYAFKFIYLLSQKWEDTDAYKLGIIDKTGKELKKIRQLKTMEEKNAYTKFNKLVYKLKRMLEKIPLAKSTIGRYATAILLIKDHVDNKNGSIEQAFLEHLERENIEFPSIAQLLSESSLKDGDAIMVFGLLFKEENESLELIENISTAGFDMGVHKMPSEKKKDLEEDSGDCSFAGNAVFNCDPDTFQNCRLGKKKYLKYSPYVGETEAGERIRKYGRDNPKKGIILRDSRTGAMLYLRRSQ